MVLPSRPIAKSAAAAQTAASAAKPSQQQRASVKPATPKPPQVLQSGHAPAQLSFFFFRG
jgi:hypothetical protein